MMPSTRKLLAVSLIAIILMAALLIPSASMIVVSAWIVADAAFVVLRRVEADAGARRASLLALSRLRALPA
jgi:hypothetical protein